MWFYSNTMCMLIECALVAPTARAESDFASPVVSSVRRPPRLPRNRRTRGQPSRRSFESHSRHDRVRIGSVRTRLSSLCTSGADLLPTLPRRRPAKPCPSFAGPIRAPLPRPTRKVLRKRGCGFVSGGIDLRATTRSNLYEVVILQNSLSTPPRGAAAPEG